MSDAHRERDHTSAQKFLRDSADVMPKVGEQYRHYKGTVVTVIGVCIREESGRCSVNYVEADGTEWNRLLSVWRETVLHDGRTIQRFTRIDG